MASSRSARSRALPAPPASASGRPPDAPGFLDAPGFGDALFTCARLLDEIAQAEVNRVAGRRVIRPALVRLLPFLDRVGIRPTLLARRVDVSKQAVGQALAELEALALVEFVADPTDGRARRVRLTDAGAAAFAHGRGVLAFYERELAARVGVDVMSQLHRGLLRILAPLQQWAAEGAPGQADAHPPPHLARPAAGRTRRAPGTSDSRAASRGARRR
jgi:DNA-binding MarR family transcriptional regulator